MDADVDVFDNGGDLKLKENVRMALSQRLLSLARLVTRVLRLDSFGCAKIVRAESAAWRVWTLMARWLSRPPLMGWQEIGSPVLPTAADFAAPAGMMDKAELPDEMFVHAHAHVAISHLHMHSNLRLLIICV